MTPQEEQAANEAEYFGRNRWGKVGREGEFLL